MKCISPAAGLRAARVDVRARAARRGVPADARGEDPEPDAQHARRQGERRRPLRQGHGERFSWSAGHLHNRVGKVRNSDCEHKRLGLD